MTISVENRLVAFVGNDVTTVFPYAFFIPTSNEVVVELYDTSSGVLTAIVDPAAFAIDGLGSESGGNVTYPLSGDPLSSSETIVIKRVSSYIQSTDLKNQGSFNADVLETALDNLVLQVQEIAEEVSRAYQVGPLTTPIPNVIDLLQLFTDNIGNILAALAAIYNKREVTAPGAIAVVDSDIDILVNKTVGEATTVNLITAVDRETPVGVIDVKGDAATNNITITPAGAETINGVAGSRVINFDHGALTLHPLPDGTGWYIK